MRKYKTPELKPGDKVAYSVQFLKSIGESHSDMAKARGIVTEVSSFGSGKLVSIDWDRDMPGKVLDANLALVGPNARFANVD